MNYLSLFLNLLNMTVENAAPYLLITIGGVFPLPSVAASPKRTLRKKCRSQIFSSSVPRCAETEAWQSPLMRRRHALYCARPAGRYKE